MAKDFAIKRPGLEITVGLFSFLIIVQSLLKQACPASRLHNGYSKHLNSAQANCQPIKKKAGDLPA